MRRVYFLYLNGFEWQIQSLSSHRIIDDKKFRYAMTMSSYMSLLLLCLVIYCLQVVPKDEATKEAMSNAIRTNLLFSHLDDSERQDIFDAMFSKNAESGEMIIRQGDNGDNFYIIHEGTAEVSMKIH